MRFLLALSLFVAAVPGLGIAAPPESPPAGLKLATFQCDATTPIGIKVYGVEVKTIEHPLWAKGVVLQDGDDRYVLCALDWRHLSRAHHLLVREKLAKAAATSPSRVAVQTLHQHTAPSGAEAGEPFLAEMSDRLAKALQGALEGLQPFDRVGTGQAKVDRVASTRRIPTGDGKVITRYTSTKGRPELRELPEGLIDPHLKTITLARGEKPLVRLHYYATHPQSFYLDGRVSSDFPGLARERLQQEEGVVQIYFTGCGGDVGAGKYNDGSRRARDELTERLLAAMRSSISATQYAPAQRLVWRTTTVTFPSKDSRGEKTVGPIELSSLEMGRTCVLHLPGEPMVAFQLFAQEQLPGHFVAVAGYGDASPGYICTEKAHAEGGYEPTATRVAPQSEALLKSAIRQLLGLK